VDPSANITDSSCCKVNYEQWTVDTLVQVVDAAPLDVVEAVIRLIWH